MAKQKIRIRLKAYDHSILDQSAEKIVETAKRSGASVSGPIPFQLRRLFTRFFVRFTSTKILVNNSKCARINVLIDIVNPTPQTVDALMRLDLPSGVDIEIKL